MRLVFFILTFIAPILSFATTNTQSTTRCVFLMLQPPSKEASAEMHKQHMKDVYDWIYAQGDPERRIHFTSAEQAQLSKILMSTTERFLTTNGIKYTLIENPDSKAILAEKVFKIEGDSASIQGRFVQMLNKEHPGYSVLFDVMKEYLTNGSASVYKNWFLVGNFKLLANPAEDLALWFHERVHLKNRKKGFERLVWAEKGKVPTLASIAGKFQNLYNNQQSFDEPEAFERSFRMTLRRWSTAIKNKDAEGIETGIRRLKVYADLALLTSGRNAWANQHLINHWGRLNADIDSVGPETSVFWVGLIDTPIDLVWMSVRFKHPSDKEFGLAMVEKKFFSQDLAENLTTMEDFKSIKSILEELDKDNIEEVTQAKDLIYNLMLSRNPW